MTLFQSAGWRWLRYICLRSYFVEPPHINIWLGVMLGYFFPLFITDRKGRKCFQKCLSSYSIQKGRGDLPWKEVPLRSVWGPSLMSPPPAATTVASTHPTGMHFLLYRCSSIAWPGFPLFSSHEIFWLLVFRFSTTFSPGSKWQNQGSHFFGLSKFHDISSFF